MLSLLLACALPDAPLNDNRQLALPTDHQELTPEWATAGQVYETALYSRVIFERIQSCLRSGGHHRA